MSTRRVSLPIVAMMSALLLGACNSGSDHLAGLDPVLDGSVVEAASANKLRLLMALAGDAGFRSEPIDWYLVTEAGFNYVQDQCTGYFDELYRFDRRREAFKSSFSAFGQTTAALLAITGTGAPSIAVAAQAFGLGSSVSDIVGGTYLYRRPPASAQTLVERLQLAFRDGAARQRAAINTPTAAYYYIQRYLSLCLPPRIEAEIDRQITATQVVAVDRGPGSPFSLETITPPSPGLPAGFGRSLGERREFFPPTFTRRRRAVETVEVDPGPVALVANARTATERKITPGFGERIQALLCQPEAADLGGPGSSRREALRTFKSVGPPGQASDTIDTDRELTLLRKAVKDYGSCREGGFASAYEVGLWAKYGGVEIRSRVLAAAAAGGVSVVIQAAGVEAGPSSDLRAALRTLDPAGKGEITPALWQRINPVPL